MDGPSSPRRSAGLAVLVLLTYSACGGRTPIGATTDAGPLDAAVSRDRCVVTASSYDTSCNVDSDCAAVWFGNVCTAGLCVGCEPNGAINSSATDAYTRDLESAVDVVQSCPCPPPQGTICCDRGTCVFSNGGCGG